MPLSGRALLDERNDRDIAIDRIDDVFAEPEIVLLSAPYAEEARDGFPRGVESQLFWQTRFCSRLRSLSSLNSLTLLVRANFSAAVSSGM